MMNLSKNNLSILTSILLIFTLTSCVLFPRDGLPEQTAKPLEMLEPSLITQAPQIEDRWWTAFGDQQLNQLVDLGLRHSPSLDIAGARIVAAQAMLETEKAAFLPQVGVGGQIDRQQLSQNYIFVPGMPVYTGYGLVNASLNWSLDIWGKQKKYYDAAKNQEKAAQANYKASELLLSTLIVRVYFDYDRITQVQVLFQQFFS